MPPFPQRNLLSSRDEGELHPLTFLKKDTANCAVLTLRLRDRGPPLCTAVLPEKGSRPGIVTLQYGSASQQPNKNVQNLLMLQYCAEALSVERFSHGFQITLTVPHCARLCEPAKLGNGGAS